MINRIFLCDYCAVSWRHLTPNSVYRTNSCSLHAAKLQREKEIVE